jgi:hypothetical protein
MRAARFAIVALVAAALPACSRSPGLFSEQNARAHVNMLADTIGSRPSGTRANALARAYVIDQLKQYGFEVRVQETDARRRDHGITARVSNIIAVLAGQRAEAIGLLSHVDSVAEGPGAGDDALGVAVALESARSLAAQRDRVWSLFVIVTDGEEHGLMGAAALVGERDVTDRLRAYLNVESIGSGGVPVLFETGPGNGWLTDAWARNAPHPRGGSYAIEIYKRLPNDTDFSIIKTQDIPGLNFAAVGDSYAYHTPRDSADRLSPLTIRTMGENAVAIVNALQRVDITRRVPADHTFFDIAGTVAVSYGPAVATGIAVVGIFLGLLAWARVLRESLRSSGFFRWLLVAFWTLLAAVAAVAAAVGAVWLLRAAREVYHPWYAYPGRLIALMLASGTAAGWALARAGRLLPARAHGARHPAITWSLTLPLWITLAGAALWFAPSAAYLWTIPLLVAGALLASVPPSRDGAVRAASILVLAVTGTLWLRETAELLRFVVAVMGRMPIVTPVFIYPALLACSAAMVAPPLLAAVAPSKPLLRPSILTTFLLAAIAVTAGLAYAAPGYTREQPLRRYARVLQEAAGTSAIWEVGSVEPGLDLAEGAPSGFAPAADPAPVSVPWGRLSYPFVFRTTTMPLGPPPARVAGFTTNVVDQGTEASINVIPQEQGVSISFVLPPGLAPARSNLPGRQRGGRWVATFIAPPPEGVTWRGSFAKVGPEALAAIQVTAWQPWGTRPPPWLPQEHAVWAGGATWVLPMLPPLAATVPLR